MYVIPTLLALLKKQPTLHVEVEAFDFSSFA